MQTNMTERDKKLLVGMFLFVIIVAIGYWGIIPQIKRYNKLENLIDIEEEKKAVNQLKLANMGMIQMTADEYDGKIAAKKDEFYPIMKSSEVDRMMTELALNEHLDIYDLSFSMPQSPTSREAYKNSNLYYVQQQQKSEYYKKLNKAAAEEKKATSSLSLDDDEEDEDDDSSNKSSDSSSEKAEVMAQAMGEEEGGYHPNTDILAVPITITVGGETADLHAFINDIIGLDKQSLLVGYSWGEYKDYIRRDANGNIIGVSRASGDKWYEDGEEAAEPEKIEGTTIEVVTRKAVTVRLELYMCDTSDIKSEGTEE